jgi:hypothetical protein
MKKCVIAALAAAFLMAGCEEKKYDQEVVDIAIGQKKQDAEIGQIATKIEGVEKRLKELQASLEKVPRPSGSTEPSGTTEGVSEGPREVEFKDAPEYKYIAARLASLQQELNLTQSGLAETRDGVTEQRDLQELRDPGQAMRAITDPEQLNRRLDLLAQNFGGTIADVSRRQQFHADLQQLREGLTNVSRQQQYENVLASLTERLNTEEADSRAREWIDRQIKELQAASGEELDGRLERYQRTQTLRQVRDLAQEYDIPREVLQESGLPSMGRGDFRRGGDRGQGGQGGRRGRGGDGG